MGGSRLVAVTTTVTFVRHGSTRWNEQGRFSGWADIPLSAAGRAQAKGLRAALAGRRWAGVWSSDLRRALETAVLAGFTPVTDRRLRELDFGDVEGRRLEDLGNEMRLAIAAFDGFSAPRGESVDDLAARLWAFLGGLPPGDHLVFTHGGPIRTVLRGRSIDRYVGPGEMASIEDPSSGEARRA